MNFSLEIGPNTDLETVPSLSDVPLECLLLASGALQYRGLHMIRDVAR